MTTSNVIRFPRRRVRSCEIFTPGRSRKFCSICGFTKLVHEIERRDVASAEVRR